MTYFNIHHSGKLPLNQDPKIYRIIQPFPDGKNIPSFDEFKGSQNFDNKAYTSQQLPNHYNSMPLLYKYQNQLTNLWNTFEPNSIITNRSCLRELAQIDILPGSKKCELHLYKVGKLSENGNRNYYILDMKANFNNYSKKDVGKFSFGLCFEAMLSKNPFHEWTTFSFKEFQMNFKNLKRSTMVYYTAEIDGFLEDTPTTNVGDNSTTKIDGDLTTNVIKDGPCSKKDENFAIKEKLIPAEIKSFHLNKKEDGKISSSHAYLAAIQCHFADVKDITMGFHDSQQIKIFKHMSLQDLEDIALEENFNINDALENVKTQLEEIIEEFEKRVENGAMQEKDILVIKIIKLQKYNWLTGKYQFYIDYKIQKSDQ